MATSLRTVTVSLVAALLLLPACSVGDADGEGTAAAAASSTPTSTTSTSTGPAMPLDGDIPPGTYRMPASGWSVAPYSVTFGKGWRVQYGNVFVRNQDSPTELGLYTVTVDRIYEDACGSSEAQRDVAPGTDALVAALAAQPGPEVSPPVATTVGARPATRVDLRVPNTLDLGTCRLALDGVDGLQVWVSPQADKYFVLLPGGSASAFVLDLAGQRQVVLTQVYDASPQEDRDELARVLDSISFEG